MEVIAWIGFGLILAGGAWIVFGKKPSLYNSRVTGEPILVKMVRLELTSLQARFNLEYKKDLRIFSTDQGSQFEPKFNQIRISKEVQGTPALREHVRHELTEAISWEVNGSYPEGHQPQTLNGVKILDVIPSWNLGYKGPKQ